MRRRRRPQSATTTGEEPSKQGNTSANCSTRTASANGDRKSGPRGLNWNPAGSAGPAGRPSRAHCAPLAPPVVSTTPPHPEASPDRPGAVTVSRIVARNSGHPQPYTGAGGSTQALGGWAGSKLERVEFPAGWFPRPVVFPTLECKSR